MSPQRGGTEDPPPYKISLSMVPHRTHSLAEWVSVDHSHSDTRRLPINTYAPAYSQTQPFLGPCVHLFRYHSLGTTLRPSGVQHLATLPGRVRLCRWQPNDSARSVTPTWNEHAVDEAEETTESES